MRVLFLLLRKGDIYLEYIIILKIYLNLKKKTSKVTEEKFSLIRDSTFKSSTFRYRLWVLKDD